MVRLDNNSIYSSSGQKLAVFIPKIEYVKKTTFLTDESDYLQVGIIKTDKVRGIPRHRHLKFERNLYQTSEYLFVRIGTCRVSIWESEDSEAKSQILGPGDSILLLGGIHGIESLTEDLELLEIKQGPYAGELDKEIID